MVESDRRVADQDDPDAVFSSSGRERVYPRSAQLEMVARAMKVNVVTFMPTGTGKTLIAVILIEKVLAELRKEKHEQQREKDALKQQQTQAQLGQHPLQPQHHPSNPQKPQPQPPHQHPHHQTTSQPERGSPPAYRVKIWFIAERVNLAIQQANYISSVTAERVKCVTLHGMTGVDRWRAKQWDQVLGNADVVVATPQVLLNALRHSMVDLTHVSLLIFDEAHHATSNHPYNRIMHEFYFELEDHSKPIIFGMTAVPVKKKGAVNRGQTRKKFLLQIRDLESNLNSRLVLPSDVHRGAMAVATPTTAEYVVNFVDHYVEPPEVSGLNIQEMDDFFDSTCPRSTPTDEMKIQRIVALVKWHIGEWAAQICDQKLRGTPLNLALPPTAEELHLTDKVRQLLRIIMSESHRHTISGGKSLFRGIVFTKIRFFAWSLTHLICAVMKICKVDTILPGFIVGHTTSGLMSLARQNVILQGFRDGDINVLISTNVIEEGLDVPSCNTVVMFDGVDTTLSYIQSSGRARHANSRYIVMMPVSSFEARTSLAAAKIGAEVLEEIVTHRSDKQIERIVPIQSVDVLRSRTTSARIPLEACKHLLGNYCTTLGGPHQTFVPRYDTFGGTTSVYLPICSSVRKASFTSDYLGPPNGNEKCHAALEALRQLYENGELDENLFPLIRKDEEVEIYDKELDPTIRGEIIEDPRNLLKTVRTLPFEGPEPLCWRPSNCAHANCEDSTIVMHLYYLQDDVPRPGLMTPNTWSTPSFALLLCLPLPGSEPTSITTIPAAKPCMTLCARGSICVSSHQVQLARNYTTLLRAIATNRPGLAQESAELKYGYLFVPFLDNAVDWTNMELALRSFEQALKQTQDANEPTVTPTSARDLEYGVVLSQHDRFGKFYHTGALDKRKPVDGSSRMERCLKKYWEEHFKLFVSQPGQLGISVWQFCPIDGTRTESQVKNPKAFIPEFLRKIEVEPMAVRMIKRLPTFEKQCTVEVLRMRMQIEFPPIDFARALSARTSESCQKEDWDYERLEYLGDTALKLQAGKVAYVNFPNAQEGFLTNVRSDATCNEFLCNIGMKFNMQAAAHMCSISTELKKWPWPVGMYTKTLELSQKVLADCVESILGLAYLNSGLDGVNEVMDSLGIIAELANPDTVPEVNWTDRRVANKRLEVFQETLGYRFKNPLLAVEALTHASYNPDSSAECTRSFGRLEYIGDSVIGLVVVELLFQRFPTMGPESLNIMKDPMVSNDFFSRFVVEKKLHHLFWHNSEPMQRTIEQTDLAVDGNVENEEMWENLTLPKTFADILEASFGAIYCDVGLDYAKAKAVILPLMMPSLETLCDLDIARAKNPLKELRDLFEKMFHTTPSYKFKILKIDHLETEKISCLVKLKNTTIVEARHTDKKKAKHFAAKAAVARLKSGDFNVDSEGKATHKPTTADVAASNDPRAGTSLKSPMDTSTAATARNILDQMELGTPPKSPNVMPGVVAVDNEKPSPCPPDVRDQTQAGNHLAHGNITSTEGQVSREIPTTLHQQEVDFARVGESLSALPVGGLTGSTDQAMQVAQNTSTFPAEASFGGGSNPESARLELAVIPDEKVTTRQDQARMEVSTVEDENTKAFQRNPSDDDEVRHSPKDNRGCRLPSCI